MLDFIQKNWGYAVAIVGFLGLLGIEIKKDWKINPIQCLFFPFQYMLGITSIKEEIKQMKQDRLFDQARLIKGKVVKWELQVITIGGLTLEQYKEFHKCVDDYENIKEKLSYLPKHHRPNGELKEMIKFIEKYYMEGKFIEDIDKPRKKK